MWDFVYIRSHGNNDSTHTGRGISVARAQEGRSDDRESLG